MTPPSYCTVCHQPGLRPFLTVRDVPYWRCEGCEATLMDPGHWLDPAREKAVYDLHDNHAEDPGYLRFLGKLSEPLMERLPPGAQGLEFGCGPGPVLAGMLRERGFGVTLYDPFFHPDASALGHTYDFVTCTEVVEHLHDPWGTFAQLDALLKPGGWLGVMTCFQTDDARFANWHYRRDPTHVVFYRESTLAHVGDRFGWTLEVPAKDVALFRKPSSS
ncbi:class I SAM-dependent methyltransferase [Marinobacter zhejiangensis]|nr:class I SAM-dependent methyltransferase [Marinobacter zhejiangensis]